MAGMGRRQPKLPKSDWFRKLVNHGSQAGGTVNLGRRPEAATLLKRTKHKLRFRHCDNCSPRLSAPRSSRWHFTLTQKKQGPAQPQARRLQRHAGRKSADSRRVNMTKLTAGTTNHVARSVPDGLRRNRIVEHKNIAVADLFDLPGGQDRLLGLRRTNPCDRQHYCANKRPYLHQSTFPKNGSCFVDFRL